MLYHKKGGMVVKVAPQSGRPPIAMLENDATKKCLLTKTGANFAPTGENAGQSMAQLAKDVDDGQVEITSLKH